MTDEEIAEMQTALKDAQESIEALKEQKKTLIGEKRAAKKAADEAADAAAEAAEEAAQQSNSIDEVKAALESKHQRALDKLQKQLDDAAGQRDKLMIDNVIARDLAMHNVAPQFRDLLTKAWKADAAVTDGAALIENTPISDFISDFVSSDAGKHYVVAPVTTGAGASGSTSTASAWEKPPQSADEWAAFGKLANERPAEANSLAESWSMPELKV